MQTAEARERQDHRCPSCGAGLVLRAGPVLTPHLAHRPRQACRRRDRAVAPGRPVQLRLFDLEPVPTPGRRRARSCAPAVRWWQEQLPLGSRRAVRYRTVRVRRTRGRPQACDVRGVRARTWWRRLVERFRPGRA